MEKFKFKSIRVKNLKLINGVPDYSNVIRIRNTYFTLTGWLEPTSSNINYVLQEITEERLKTEPFTKSALVQYIENERNIK